MKLLGVSPASLEESSVALTRKPRKFERKQDKYAKVGESSRNKFANVGNYMNNSEKYDFIC